jgi:hypothetical protein
MSFPTKAQMAHHLTQVSAMHTGFMRSILCNAENPFDANTVLQQRIKGSLDPPTEETTGELDSQRTQYFSPARSFPDRER